MPISRVPSGGPAGGFPYIAGLPAVVSDVRRRGIMELGRRAAPAKLNLALDILGPRPDGYHEMRMVMHTVSLCDWVSLREEGEGFSLETEGGFCLPPGKKTIAWIHSDVYHLGQESLKEELALQDKAFYKTDRIVSISDITTESLEALFPQHKSRIKVLWNGLDIEKVRIKAREDTAVKLEHPALLYIGRLEERKDPLRLLNIFAKVHKQEPKAHLYYLGYGGLSGDVRDSAEKLGLSNQVHLLGYHDNPFPIMAQCDVVCMFSQIEGFPMVLLEGVALDKPFVSSVIGGSRILANGQKCGRTVETDEEAVDAIFDMLKSDRENIKNECRKSIKRFELKEYIRQIEELFDEVLEDEN